MNTTPRSFRLVSALLFGAAAYAQHDGHPPGHRPPQPPVATVGQPAPLPAPVAAVRFLDPGLFLMQQASGTSVNPLSSRMPMVMFHAGEWMAMLHGVAFVNQIVQTGPRGHDKLFSTNWIMASAQRRAGGGVVQFRTMLSLEPATVTGRYYPLLFQTGETAFGRPIVDGQHPHDLFMELGAQYARRVAETTQVSLYAAVVGDPALGPVAFPHRVSAANLPQATLGHHLQDSTHIAYSVVTAGVRHGIFRLEASGFHGAEPDEARWNLSLKPIDSWAGRFWAEPNENWAAQVSLGRLKNPEAAHFGDVVRSTASVSYNRPLTDGNWASTLLWGRNHKTADQVNLNSYLLESTLWFRNRNHISGRIELVDRDEHELFPENGGDSHPHLPERVFRIGAYTLGYTRDVAILSGLRIGLGGNFTLYSTPRALKPFYGDRPAGFLFYLRVQPSAMQSVIDMGQAMHMRQQGGHHPH